MNWSPVHVRFETTARPGAGGLFLFTGDLPGSSLDPLARWFNNGGATSRDPIRHKPLATDGVTQELDVHSQEIAALKREFLDHCQRLSIPVAVIPRLAHGFDVAAKMLGECKRKSGELFLNHPVRVTKEFLIEASKRKPFADLTNEELAVVVDRAVAYLNHDSIEEHPEHLESSSRRIKAEFKGRPAVFAIITGLTQHTRTDNPDSSMEIRWRDRISFLQQISAASISNPAVAEGKFFDVWDNAGDLSAFEDSGKIGALARRVHWFELVQKELFDPNTRRAGLEFVYVTDQFIEAMHERIVHLITRYTRDFGESFTRELTAHRLLTTKLLNE